MSNFSCWLRPEWDSYCYSHEKLWARGESIRKDARIARGLQPLVTKMNLTYHMICRLAPVSNYHQMPQDFFENGISPKRLTTLLINLKREIYGHTVVLYYQNKRLE